MGSWSAGSRRCGGSSRSSVSGWGTSSSTTSESHAGAGVGRVGERVVGWLGAGQAAVGAGVVVVAVRDAGAAEARVIGDAWIAEAAALPGAGDADRAAVGDRG